MNIFITNTEGGIWRPVSASLKVLPLLMYPHVADGAVMFPNGAVYDNVLAKLGWWPWRRYDYEFVAEFSGTQAGVLTGVAKGIAFSSDVGCARTK